VSTNILGYAVDRQVGAKLERRLKVGRAKGVVDGQPALFLFACLGNCHDVRNLERGIRWALNPNKLRIGFERKSNDRAHVTEVDLNSHVGPNDPSKVPLRPPVHVINAEDVISRLQAVDNRCSRGAPRRKSDGEPTPLFSRYHGPLECSTRRIASTRVLVPGSERIEVVDCSWLSWRELPKGSCHANGDDYRPRWISGGRILVLTGAVQVRCTSTSVRILERRQKAQQALVSE
jgi:hypothetical protein